MSIKYIDMDLTNSILKNINSGVYDNVVPVEVSDIPGIDGVSVIDHSGLKHIGFYLDEVCTSLRRINPNLREYLFGTLYGKTSGSGNGQMVTFSRDELEQIGIQLYPYTAYGILNGGSATSYSDSRKNTDLNPELMRLYRSLFEKSSQNAAGKAKGITPAYINSDGTSGPSFMELKLRSLLIANLRYRMTIDRQNELFEGDSAKHSESAMSPMFQMTSVYNNEQITQELESYRTSPMLSELIETTGVDICRPLTGIQPMIAALTHSSVGKPKQVFSNAWGRDGELLPMPGGHGQNFLILSEVYSYLYNDLGKKFAWLGNVDNIGNIPDPVSLALTAMSGCEASFEFAFRTPVDVKGGILIRDKSGRLNCADIGPAISKEEVDRQEAAGKKILFNCATGLFSLEYLTENITGIIKNLPMRITDQNKDAGRYAQAEQVTWEIIGMLETPLILGVNKYDRYLAAKLLLESFMTSGLKLDDDSFPSHEDPEKDFRRTAENLYEGLRNNLSNGYGMKEVSGVWHPLSVEELKAEFRRK